ncbi:hypothetical protein HDU97_003647 [Phlyctochytrium planicorne]|nr:hypothetical protein HDU97_003647 [Phlyctochytrium planicorne]
MAGEGGSQHELNEADLLQLEGDFEASHPPQKPVPAGDSVQSLLDLELAEPEIKTEPEPPIKIEDRTTGSSSGGSPTRKITTFGKNMADAFKRGMRSRSPSVTHQTNDSAIPFSTTANTTSSNNEIDFFASVAESQSRGRVHTSKSAAVSPERTSVDPKSANSSRMSLEQRLQHHRSSTTPSDGVHAAAVSPSAVITDLSSSHNFSLSQNRLSQVYADDPPQLVPVPVMATTNIDPKFSKLPTKRWTDFSIFHQIPNMDPVVDIINKAFSNDDQLFKPNRHLLTLEEAERQHGPERALDALIQHRSWKSVRFLIEGCRLTLCDKVANLARNRLLGIIPTPDNLPSVVKWWVTRLNALERLKLYDTYFSELDALGNIESAAFQKETYPEIFPDGKGSFVHFDLRLIWARSPSLKGNSNEALSRLFRLLYAIRKESKPGLDAQICRSQEVGVQLSIVSMLVDLKDYRSAVSFLEGLVITHQDVDLLSALGRVHLQFGGISEARICLQRVETLLKLPSTAASEREAFKNYDTVLLNRAFLAIAEGDWESSARWLNDLIAHDTSNATAINNLAICHLYMGDLSRAISFLESVIVEMPLTAGASSALLFNLSTLFDLADRSLERKQRVVSNVVAKSAGDDLDLASLKLGGA